MKLALRQRIKLGPNMYANIGIHGVSISIKTGNGTSMNIGKKGTYLNTSIPGTGLHKRTKIK